MIRNNNLNEFVKIKSELEKLSKTLNDWFDSNRQVLMNKNRNKVEKEKSENSKIETNFKNKKNNKNKFNTTKRKKEKERKNYEDDSEKKKFEIHETENNILVQVEVPVINKEDINVYIDDSSISIEAKNMITKRVTEQESENYIEVTQRYLRTISLPATVISNKAKVDYKNGIMKIQIPKRKQDDNKDIADYD